MKEAAGSGAQSTNNLPSLATLLGTPVWSRAGCNVVGIGFILNTVARTLQPPLNKGSSDLIHLVMMNAYFEIHGVDIAPLHFPVKQIQKPVIASDFLVCSLLRVSVRLV